MKNRALLATTFVLVLTGLVSAIPAYPAAALHARRQPSGIGAGPMPLAIVDGGYQVGPADGAEAVNGGSSSPNGSAAVSGPGGTDGEPFDYLQRCRTFGCVAALSPGCVTQFNDPRYYNWISLRNNCGEEIDLQFSRIGIGGAGQGEVAPGGTINTGFSDSEAPSGLTIAVCPAGYVAWSTDSDGIWMGSGGFVCLRNP